MWKDCHYIPALDATVTAEWYFTGRVHIVHDRQIEHSLISLSWVVYLF